MGVVEVAVLGRPTVRVDGHEVPLQGRQLLLALRLALAGRVPVTREALMDVWPADSGTDGALRVALTRLRGVLGNDVIRRTGHGYLLDPPAVVDADEFTRLVRSSNDSRTSRDERFCLLDEALALWTANAYAGIEGFGWIDHEVVRLTELREQSIDRRFELELDRTDRAGRKVILPELIAAADRRPEREHRTALAASALYHSERQADALAMIARTRSVLLESYGLDPGQEIRDLELGILRHDLDDSAREATDEQRGELTSRIHAATGLLKAGADEALPIAREAVQLARDQSDRPRLATALLLTAQAMVMTGDGDPGPFIHEAQRLARTMSDGHVLARAALVKFGRGIPADRHAALIELGEPLDMLPSSAPVRIELLCASAAIISLTGAGPGAERVVRAAEREHHEIGSARTEAVWLAARSIVAAVDGSEPEALSGDAERSLQLAEAADDPVLLTIAYQAILRLAYATGDLARVDSILEPLADASDRALLRFGTVRCHLCAVTNAIARGELDDVRDLIATARDVGHRFRTHAVDTATASQELLLELELDVLHRRGDVLEAMAAIHPHTQAATIAALARPHDDDAYERLPDMVDRLPRDDSFPAVIALTTLLAADRRDPVLGRRCIDLLDPLGDRILTVGFGSIVLGPACIHTGIANIAVGDLDAAEASLRRAVRLATKSTAWLWAATADLWLAEAMLERRRGDDAAAALSRVAAVEESGRFGETWRIGRQAALLRRAASEGVSPGKLRAQQRHRPGVAHDAG